MDINSGYHALWDVGIDHQASVYYRRKDRKRGELVWGGHGIDTWQEPRRSRISCSLVLLSCEITPRTRALTSVEIQIPGWLARVK